MTKVADNPVQIGQFDIGDGKLLTLARFVKNERNCIYENQPCGILDPCCSGLTCDGLIEGRCVKSKPCITEHQPCGALDPCCAGLICTDPFQGECVQRKPCITEHQPCGVLDPCCSGLYCTGLIQGECVSQGLGALGSSKAN
ncbi:hypothetical protein QVD17_14775 [Tagetes erecta]|nr:hypothetical protein QVD17_14775 [Tagetes erecta]